MKIKIDDQVLITIGKDKGRKGKVIKVLPKDNAILVEGINLYKRHRKAAYRQPGGIIKKPRPLNMAKVALICPKCQKPTRVGVELEMNSKIKQRICKKCKKTI